MVDSPIEPAGPVASQVLHGPHHPTLGARTVRAVGPLGAVGLSAGRYPKAAPALDANEDAVLGVAGPGGAVIAVADGHLGADAACAAVDAVAGLAHRVAGEAPVRPRRGVAELAHAAAEAVAHARAASDRRDTATALSVVAVAGRAAWVVTFGDTAVVRVRRGRAKPLSRAGPFLAAGTPVPTPRRHRLRPGDEVVAASDGVTDHLGRGWPGQVARRVAVGSATGEAAAGEAASASAAGRPPPRAVVDAVLLGAMAGAAGDHLSCAMVRCP